MNLFVYLRESLKELKRVSWPKKEFTFYMSVLIIFLSAIIGTFLGFFDVFYSIFFSNFIF